jgi:DNA helicase IV
VVALHRAAYLLYTHRFPLEDQGVLVIGPNRVFLRYIERVLPSLGEAGVEQVVLADLVPDVLWARPGIDPTDSTLAAKVKGDSRVSAVIDKAVQDRERPLREELRVPFRTGFVRLSVEESARIVKAARRRYRRHNGARRFVENEVFAAMAASWRGEAVSARELRQAIRPRPDVRAALERIWPVLTPAELLHDLFGSRALLDLAASSRLSEHEIESLYRPRSADVGQVRWTSADVALLDDAREVLGPRLGRGGKVDDGDEIRTYGHIVVDEVQDLTPMQLKMAARRSLNGSMTVVGDIAQATGPLAPDDWDDVLAYLPDRKPARVVGLSVGYRIPAQIMELADRVMVAATPQLRSPRAVRVGDATPAIVGVAGNGDFPAAVAEATAKMAAEIRAGNLAVVVPDALADEVSRALAGAGIEHGRATRTGLDDPITVVPVSVVKGLELDGVVVVEPARIVSDEIQGLRALYVALTRPTQRLTVIHAEPLPPSMV